MCQPLGQHGFPHWNFVTSYVIWQQVANRKKGVLTVLVYIFAVLDWIEFSPYEVALPKYGLTMPLDLYGSKFFMGKVIQKFDEFPLHYLMGNKSNY